MYVCMYYNNIAVTTARRQSADISITLDQVSAAAETWSSVILIPASYYVPAARQ